jgi:hypothetical protein
MSSEILNSTDNDLPVGACETEEVESGTIEEGTDATESFVQQIFGPARPEIEFEEGRPWSPPTVDPFVAAFQEHVGEAEVLERQIADIEGAADQLIADTKGSLAPLEKQQIVACFEAWKLFAEGNVPVSVMDQYALEAGVKAHGNQKIPCSRFMRTIMATDVIKGTRVSKHKQARASTYASAIDFGIRKGMSEEAFAAELDQPRKRGEHHGIEHLAAEGRKARQSTSAEHSADQVAEALDRLEEGGGFLVSGDFTDVEPGYRLVVIHVPAETTITETHGQIIDPIEDAVVQRILRNWIKSRAAIAPDENDSRSSVPI